MSIIHDALKKAQTMRRSGIAATTVPVEADDRFGDRRWQLLVIFSILLFCASMIHALTEMHYLPVVIRLPTEQPQQHRLAVFHKPVLELNGVFVSKKSHIAMINNKLYTTGDVVGGMKITAIAYGSVRLERDGHRMVLKKT